MEVCDHLGTLQLADRCIPLHVDERSLSVSGSLRTTSTQKKSPVQAFVQIYQGRVQIYLFWLSALSEDRYKTGRKTGLYYIRLYKLCSLPGEQLFHRKNMEERAKVPVQCQEDVPCLRVHRGSQGAGVAYCRCEHPGKYRWGTDDEGDSVPEKEDAGRTRV